MFANQVLDWKVVRCFPNIPWHELAGVSIQVKGGSLMARNLGGFGWWVCSWVVRPSTRGLEDDVHSGASSSWICLSSFINPDVGLWSSFLGTYDVSVHRCNITYTVYEYIICIIYMSHLDLNISFKNTAVWIWMNIDCLYIYIPSI